MRKIVPALEAAFASVVWGVSFVATKIALTQVSPVTVVWMRFALGVLILGATVLWRREILLPRARNGAILPCWGSSASPFTNGFKQTDYAHRRLPPLPGF